jgi:hypothetical protein
MVIRIFIFSLLIISTISLLLTVNNDISDSKSKDIALITFKDSTMYTMDDENVVRVIRSKKAVRYRNRDEMYNGILISKIKSKEIKDSADIISADFIEKKGSKLKFVDHVKYDREDFLSLKTDLLHYDLESKIAYNNKPFIGKYYDDFLIGSELYFDANKAYFRSKKALFEINTK